jgi:chaperonin GroES
MRVRPLHDRLLVRRIEEEETANTKILVPETAKRKPWRGEVLAVGNDEDPNDVGQVVLDVKVGDKILFGGRSGTPAGLSGKNLLILPEDEFLVLLT